MEKAQEHTAINSIPFACLLSSYHVLGNKTKKPYSDKQLTTMNRPQTQMTQWRLGELGKKEEKIYFNRHIKKERSNMVFLR